MLRPLPQPPLHFLGIQLKSAERRILTLKSCVLWKPTDAFGEVLICEAKKVARQRSPPELSQYPLMSDSGSVLIQGESQWNLRSLLCLRQLQENLARPHRIRVSAERRSRQLFGLIQISLVPGHCRSKFQVFEVWSLHAMERETDSKTHGQKKR